MSEARPLLETGSEAERTLLAAGVAERPDMASVRRAATVVGLFPKVALAGLAFAMTLRAMRWTSIVAWGAVPAAGMVGLGLVAHDARWWQVGRVPSASAPVRTATLSSAVAPAAVPATEVRLEGAVFPQQAKQAPVAAPRPRVRPLAHGVPGPSASTAPHQTAESLREQAQLLDRARVLTASGDAKSSLALLDRYDRRFGGKALSEEAFLLRIEALARNGERAAALTMAQQFARSYPASVHGDRVAALIQTLAQ